MANINRDYLVVLDVKTGNATAPNMYFYNTDKSTSNIYVQLVVKETVVKATPIENATDFVIVAKIIKPGKVLKEMTGVLVNIEEAIYEFDLPTDFTNLSGNYDVEFWVSAKVSDSNETITSSNIMYTVKQSILTELDPSIEDTNDYPLLIALKEELESLKNSGQNSHTHENKSVLDGITSAKVTNWDTAYTHSQSTHFNGNYNNLTDKPIIPTNTSQLINDSGFITESSIDFNFIDDTTINTNKTWSSSKIDSQIKDIANNKATKQELEVERARINNFVTLKDGSTTGDAELIDGRIGADGINYGNLGTAIRTQFSDINMVLDKPTYLMRNASYEKEGGDVIWDNITIDLAVKENTIYSISYGGTDCNLADDDTVVTYTLLDSNSNPIIVHTDLFSKNEINVNKQITTVANTAKLRLFLSLSRENALAKKIVHFYGLNVYEGVNNTVTIKPEAIGNVAQNITDMFELNLPKDIYVATNYPLEIYNKHVCYCGNINNYHFKWSLPSGKNMGRKLVIQGNPNLNGSTEPLNLKVYDNNLNLVAEANSTVHYKTPSASLKPSDYKKILCIGDSLTEIPIWRENLKRRLQDEIGDMFYYIGNLGTEEFKHEGHSGWTIDNFVSNTGEGWNGNYKVKVASDPGTITPKKQYKFGEKIFEFEKQEVENGEIWLYFNRINGGGLVEENSTAVEVTSSVTGIATINYTNVAITSRNPFFNPATQQFDANYYSGNLGIAPDYCFVWLGANGVSESLDINANLDSATINITKLKTIIDDILAKWTNTKIFVCYNHYYSNQSGLGFVSGTWCFDKAIELGVFNTNKKIKETFENYNDRVILVPIGQTHDSEYNYQFDMVGVNNRNNIAKEMMCYDKVHPFKDTGFLQFTDTIYATLINNL